MDALTAAVTFVTTGIPNRFIGLGAAIADAIRAMINSVREFFSMPPMAPAVPALPAPSSGVWQPGGGALMPIPPVPAIPGGGGALMPIPLESAAPRKQSYNAVPPPAGGSQGGGGGDVYLDVKKVGDILAREFGRSMGGPIQGSALFDGTQSSPAQDLSLSYG
jgi:hypothetical protein